MKDPPHKHLTHLEYTVSLLDFFTRVEIKHRTLCHVSNGSNNSSDH